MKKGDQQCAWEPTSLWVVDYWLAIEQVLRAPARAPIAVAIHPLRHDPTL